MRFLEDNDLIYVHVESPDEAGHVGDVVEKVKAIENIDNRLARLLVDGMEAAGYPYRFLIMPDDPTPLGLKTHTSDPVPFAICGSDEPAGPGGYDEDVAAATGLLVEEGYHLMDELVGVSGASH